MRRAGMLLTLLALVWRLSAPTDAAAQPAPAAPAPAAGAALKLPFAAGTAWKVLQGYNGGTHVPGPERYALDLVRDGGPTTGAELFAPIAGTVWWMNPPGSGNGCLLIKSEGPSGLIVQMCHIVAARAFRTDEKISAGQPLGRVGGDGTVGNNGIAHLHYSLHRTSDYGVTRMPAPFAAPDGLNLEGVALPPDGAYNQYACPGRSCKPSFVSTLGRADAPRPTPPASAPGVAPTPVPAGAPLAPSVPLRAGVTARVTGGDCLNVREAASLTAKVLACVSDGVSVTIGQGPVQADGRQWWQIDERGWAAADFLSGVSAPTPTLKVAVGVQVDAGENDCLNLRKEADTSAAVITCLPSGARMSITAGPREADGHTWWELDGRGWAAADYLRPRDDA